MFRLDQNRGDGHERRLASAVVRAVLSGRK